MSRAATRIKQVDVVRAVKGALAAGLTVARVEVDGSGKIVVICGEAAPDLSPSPGDFEARLRAAKGWEG